MNLILKATEQIPAFLADAYNNLAEPAVIVDSDLTIVFANAAFRSQFFPPSGIAPHALPELLAGESNSFSSIEQIRTILANHTTEYRNRIVLSISGILCSGTLNCFSSSEQYYAQLLIESGKHDSDISNFILKNTAYLEILAQSINAVMYYYDFASCSYQFLSQNATYILGYTREEVNAIGFHKLIKKHDKVAPFQYPPDIQLIQHPQLGAGVENEYQIRMKDGSLRWFLEKATKVKDSKGKNVGQLGTLRDFTENKNNLLSLHETQKNLQHLLDFTPVGLAVIQDARVAYANNEMCQMIHAESEEEVLDKSFYRFVPRDQMKQVQALVTEMLQNNTPVYEFELDLYALDRSRLAVSGSMIPIQYLGRPAIQLILRDVARIGSAKRARRAILKILQAADTIPDLKEFFKVIHDTLAENMPMNNFYIALLNKQDNMLTFPYGVDEYDTFEDSPLNEKSLTSLVLRRGETMLVTKEADELLRKEGLVELIGEPAAIWLGIPLRIQNEVIGVMVVQDYHNKETYTTREKDLLEPIAYSIAHAIERKRTESERLELIEKLKEMNVSKDAFFSIISHDLRSPFTSIMGFINILLTDYKELTDAEIYDLLLSLNNVAGNVLNMVVNLLEFSRFQLGRMEFNPASLELEPIVLSVAGMLQGNISKKHLELVVDVPHDARVFADGKMLISVLQNLLSNAIKFAFERQKIVVGFALSDDGHTVISVKDEGMGMTAEQVNNLFKLDKIHSRPGTKNEPGTGIGLILVKDFIKKHGGKVTVESSLTAGTTFFVALPHKQ